MAELSKELEKKVDEAFNNSFIGDVVFDTEELNIIQNYLREHDEDWIKRSYFDRKCLFVLIVNKAKKWGTDKENDRDKYFAEQMFNDIFEIEGKEWKDYGLIDFYNETEGKRWLKDSKGNTSRYKQTFLYNAFAPKNSIYAFIELIFNVLTNPENVRSGFFDNTFEEDARDYKTFVAKINEHFLKSKVNSSDEIVNLYNHSYKITAALRHGFHYDQENIAKLVSRTVSYIKKYISRETSDDSSYYYELTKDYLTLVKHSLNDNVKETIKTDKVRSIKDWYAYYAWSGSNSNVRPCVYLKMPILKLQSLDQYTNLRLFLYLNDNREPVYEEKIDVYGEDYNPHLRPETINITNHLTSENNCFNFRIKIYSEEKLIYDSKENLYRSFLIFSKNSEKEFKDVVTKVRRDLVAIFPNNLAKKFNDDDLLDAEFYDLLGSYGHAYELKPNEGDYIEFNDKRIIFTNTDKDPTLSINGIVNDKIKFERPSGERISVYNNIDSIILPPSQKTVTSNLIEAEIIVKEIDTGKEFQTIIPFDISGNKNKTVILDFKNEILKNGGYIHILFIDKTKNYKLGVFECLLGNYDLRFEPKLPNKHGKYNCLYYENDNLIQHIDNKNESDEIFYIEKEYGKICCFLPYLKYNFEGVKNQNYEYLAEGKQRSFYIDDILDLNNAHIIIECKALLCEPKMLLDKNEITPTIKDDKYIFDLSGLIIKNAFLDYSSISIMLKNKTYEIYRIYKKEMILNNNVKVLYDDESCKFSYNIAGYIGKSDSIFQIELYDEDGINYKSDLLYNLQGEFTIKDFEDGFYYFKIIRIYDEDKKIGKSIYKYENDYLEFGDCNKVRFKNIRFDLLKCKNKDGQNVKFKNYNIANFTFVGYTPSPTYKASLYIGKHKISDGIYVAFKNESNAIIYSVYNNNELSNQICFNSVTAEIALTLKNGYESLKSVYLKEN